MRLIPKTDPAARLEKIRASLSEAQERLAARRTELGTAVADDDEGAAAKLRSEVARLEARCAELESAVPVAEQRVQESQERDERRRQAQEARVHNERRARCIRAARDFDAAMAKVGEAFATLATEFGADTSKLRMNLPEHTKVMLRGALYHWAPHLGRMLYVEPIAHQFRTPLALGMEGLRTKEVDDDALAG